MIGVTIGTGNWGEVALNASSRMQFNTGLECFVIEQWHEKPYEHPVWIKCRILDLFPNENEFLYFDADIWSMKKWNPAQIFREHGMNICAVPEPAVASIDREKSDFRFPKDYSYVNCGLLMFSRWHKKYFDYALKLHPNYGRWYDQTPLNEAFLKWGNVEFLDGQFNTLAHQGKVNGDLSEAVNLHFCSCKSAEYVRELQKKHGG